MKSVDPNMNFSDAVHKESQALQFWKVYFDFAYWLLILPFRLKFNKMTGVWELHKSRIQQVQHIKFFWISWDCLKWEFLMFLKGSRSTERFLGCVLFRAAAALADSESTWPVNVFWNYLFYMRLTVPAGNTPFLWTAWAWNAGNIQRSANHGVWILKRNQKL